MQAKDIMTRNVISISSAANIRHAIELMLTNGISGLPVVDDSGRVCGMLTEGDLLTRREITTVPRSITEPKMTAVADLEQYIKKNSWSVSDVMSVTPVLGSPQSEMAELGQIMRDRGIKRIPIVEHGRLVGIVSRRDLLQAIVISNTRDMAAGSDEAIRLAILTRLRADLGIDCQALDITVRNGQVSVEGTIESELQRKAVRVLVEGIRGTNGYVDRLRIPTEAGPRA
jgi:CBS domain-containing protein